VLRFVEMCVGECLRKCVDVCMRVCECVPVRAYVKASCFVFRQNEGQQERDAWLEGLGKGLVRVGERAPARAFDRYERGSAWLRGGGGV